MSNKKRLIFMISPRRADGTMKTSEELAAEAWAAWEQWRTLSEYEDEKGELL